MEVDVHLGTAQRGQVPGDVGLADIVAGDQEADHKGGVEHLAEAELLGDVERDPEQGSRRHLAVQQRVEPLIGRPLEGEADVLRRQHGLQGLHGGEVAAGVVATPIGTPARSSARRTGESGGTTMEHGATE